MGGAGGHMWHPFDCPDVNSGQDLISFFQKSIESAKANPPALKIDGVNLSFRLRENPSMEAGYEFVIDRGSMKALDVQGVTADNAHERFVSKDPSQPHGMINATEILLSIFNAALPEVISDLQQLGMTEDIGPYGKYFNTEFVLKKINVKEYAFDFIALHGVNQFVKKGPRSRKGVAVEADQVILDTVRDKVRKYAAEKDFRVFTRIPAEITKEVELEKALGQEFTVVYSSQMRDPEDTGELGIGEGSTKTIRDWLAGVSENPLNKVVYISDEMRQKYPQMSKKQSPYAKNIYLEVLKGTPVNEIAATENDVEPLVDAVVIMHSTRILGNSMLDALESDEFGPARDQEGVVVNDPEICGGTSFKFTGDFIVGGLASTFEEHKFRSEQLLETFGHEEISVNEQKEQYVVLIPGGFKPPTAGHYSMIKQYDKKSDIVKVFVITGFKPREGVTYEQSREIFDLYGGFSNKVEFRDADQFASPMTACYELIKDENFRSQFPRATFSLGAGDKGDDSKRIKDLVRYFKARPELGDINVSDYPPAKSLMVDGRPASASRMRTAFSSEDWETFKKLLPHESLYDNVIKILSQGGGLEESFFTLGSLFSLVESVLEETQTASVIENKKVSQKISYLIDKENKKPDQAAAIALSMAERGELEEQELKEKQYDDIISEEDEARKLNDFKERIAAWAANISSDPLLQGLPDEDIERLASELANLAFERADDYLEDKPQGEERVQQIKKNIGKGFKLESSMSGQSVAGAAGSPWPEDMTQESRVSK